MPVLACLTLTKQDGLLVTLLYVTYSSLNLQMSSCNEWKLCVGEAGSLNWRTDIPFEAAFSINMGCLRVVGESDLKMFFVDFFFPEVESHQQKPFLVLLICCCFDALLTHIGLLMQTLLYKSTAVSGMHASQETVPAEDEI